MCPELSDAEKREQQNIVVREQTNRILTERRIGQSQLRKTFEAAQNVNDLKINYEISPLFQIL
jgi:hypothetical protein